MNLKSVCLAVMLGVAAGAVAHAAELSPLKVLYVGNDPATVTLSEMDRAMGTPDRVLELKKSRAPAFEKLLKEYFRTVKVVYGTDYKESMSTGYDVTIFDAVPKAIKAQILESDPKTGETTRYEPAQYLTPQFDAAAILISDVSPRISEPLEYKMDWLCLCLDSYAHGMKLDHPIFNTPYKVKATIEYKPTPPNYLHYYSGRALPDTMPMLRMQTEGYSDGKGYPAGLVSTGAGFVDAGDSEIISNGVCQKGYDSVAIGRHGNFFHWGFSASPNEMTEAGKLAFINAVHYIAKFKGQHPYSHRPYRTGTRAWALDLAYMMSKMNYEEWTQMQKSSHESRKSYLLKMKQAGQKLSESDLKAIDEPMPALPDRDQWLKTEVLGRQPPALVEKLGTDLNKYVAYYEANLPYLKPAKEQYTYEVDEDVRSLALSNRDPELLELCVTMLEGNVDAPKATRILTRYTGENLQSATQWRQWLNTNRARLYFSDVDGFKFHVAPAGRS